MSGSREANERINGSFCAGVWGEMYKGGQGGRGLKVRRVLCNRILLSRYTM